MRTPKRHVTAAGEVYYRVRYRRDNRQHALTFDGPAAKAEADEFARLIDTLGVDRAVAWWNANLEPTETGPTVDEWFDRYLKAMTGVTEGTRITYRRTYDRVWAPAIGSKPAAAVTREDIAHVVNDMSERQGKADKTVRNAYGVIASAFKVAVADQVVPTTPCTKVRLPRRTEHVATEMRFLHHGEWDRLLRELPAHYRPLFTMLIGTGMRWGEAEALTVGDIEFTPTPLVRITKAAKWDASKATRAIGPTKTRRSKRTITLPAPVTEAIAPLVVGRSRTARLFTAPLGGDLRHRTVYDEWKRAVEAAELDPHPRIHDLRHTHVAWLIAAGIPLPVIQARLGHESIQTTVDRYGHLMPDLQIAAANAAALAMQGADLSAALTRPHPPDGQVSTPALAPPESPA